MRSLASTTQRFSLVPTEAIYTLRHNSLIKIDLESLQAYQLVYSQINGKQIALILENPFIIIIGLIVALPIIGFLMQVFSSLRFHYSSAQDKEDREKWALIEDSQHGTLFRTNEDVKGRLVVVFIHGILGDLKGTWGRLPHLLRDHLTEKDHHQDYDIFFAPPSVALAA